MYSSILLQVHIALSLWLNKKLKDIRNWRTTSFICVFMWGSTWISILQVRWACLLGENNDWMIPNCDQGSYHFLWGGGMSIRYRQSLIFSGPPLSACKKNWHKIGAETFGSTLCHCKKFCPPLHVLALKT